jgi:hypothetical protein
MKKIESFFELLITYNNFKYKLKMDYEKLKCDLRIAYAEKMKELNNN